MFKIGFLKISCRVRCVMVKENGREEEFEEREELLKCYEGGELSARASIFCRLYLLCLPATHTWSYPRSATRYLIVILMIQPG